jgi:hypothetical protein
MTLAPFNITDGKWERLAIQIRQYIYLSLIIIVLGWLALSAWAYLSVLNIFNSIPGNEELISLAIERNISIAVVSPSFDENFLSAFLYAVFIGPIVILSDCIALIVFKRFTINGSWILIAFLSIVIGILSLRSDFFGWYSQFIID